MTVADRDQRRNLIATAIRRGIDDWIASRPVTDSFLDIVKYYLEGSGLADELAKRAEIRRAALLEQGASVAVAIFEAGISQQKENISKRELRRPVSQRAPRFYDAL